MTDTLFADVSEWQAGLNESYEYKWLAIRSNDGTYRDKNWWHNWDTARRMLDTGQILGLIVYFVYRPNWEDALHTHIDMQGEDRPDVVTMVDVETWGGQISGDNSHGINSCVWGASDWRGGAMPDGTPRRVCAYLNPNDAHIWPNRPSPLPYVVPAYGSYPRFPPHLADVENGMFAHQYTDGGGYGGGLPEGASPFGNCDMNAANGLDPWQLRVRLGIDTAPVEPVAPPEFIEPPVEPPPEPVAPPESTEKVLDYNRDIVPQETFYWCGPASTQVVLNGMGVHVSEQTLADQMGTHTGGTDYVGLVENALDHFVPERQYASAYTEQDPMTAQQKDKLWADIVYSIDAGAGLVMNWVAPPNNYPIGVKGSISPAYAGGTVYHYVAAMGYDSSGARAVWIADSGFWPYGYWVSFDQCATLIPPKGYTWSTAPHTVEPTPPPIEESGTPKPPIEECGCDH